MTFEKFSGTAEQYIGEYLDPNGTLNSSPTTPEEARAMWRSLEETFKSAGGTGMSEDDFVAAVARMQAPA